MQLATDCASCALNDSPARDEWQRACEDSLAAFDGFLLKPFDVNLLMRR